MIKSNEKSIYIAHDLHKLADNFRECMTLNAVYDEILKLHFFFTELQYDYTLKETRLKGKMRHSVFFYLVWFHTCLVRVTQYDFP